MCPWAHFNKQERISNQPNDYADPVHAQKPAVHGAGYGGLQLRTGTAVQEVTCYQAVQHPNLSQEVRQRERVRIIGAKYEVLQEGSSSSNSL